MRIVVENSVSAWREYGNRQPINSMLEVNRRDIIFVSSYILDIDGGGATSSLSVSCLRTRRSCVLCYLLHALCARTAVRTSGDRMCGLPLAHFCAHQAINVKAARMR